MENSVWIGFDPREAHAYAVARHSLNHHIGRPIPVLPIVMQDLVETGVYTRETIKQNGRLFDVISEHPMATEFAISRFLTPYLASQESAGNPSWALFLDADVMVRRSIDPLWNLSKSKAVYVVKHDFRPAEATKMDGQVQTQYSRKNWSSVMLFNLQHPANNRLTLEMINSLPGRDLHAFCWLKDEEIGELPPEYNYLVGFHTAEQVPDPRIVHFTDGIPTMVGYEECEYAADWNSVLRRWSYGRR